MTTKKVFSYEREFSDTFQSIAEEVRDILMKRGMPEEAVTRVREMIEYTALGGKMSRCYLVMSTLELSTSAQGGPTSAQFHEAITMGWCIELASLSNVMNLFNFKCYFQLQAAFLVADDVMDESLQRRGKPSWVARVSTNMLTFIMSYLIIHFGFVGWIDRCQRCTFG